jgi:hypothetical protein
MSLKITHSELRKIIAEELSILREGVDHEGVKHVVTSSSKLLKALEAFKDSEPTVAQVNAMTPHLDTLIGLLEAMIQNPASYVAVVRPPPKTVKLRAVKDD